MCVCTRLCVNQSSRSYFQNTSFLNFFWIPKTFRQLPGQDDSLEKYASITAMKEMLKLDGIDNQDFNGEKI